MQKIGHDEGWEIGLACASSTKEYAYEEYARTWRA
jgi:hypothetical protein